LNKKQKRITKKENNSLLLAVEVFILINLKDVAKGYERFLLRNGSVFRQAGHVFKWGSKDDGRIKYTFSIPVLKAFIDFFPKHHFGKPY
jgi:hypothetical protein